MIADLFGASPVGPMETHIGIVHKCANQLDGFFRAAVAGDWAAAAKYRAKIERLEHEADDLKKEIRLSLPKSLFMPVPRGDLLELLLVQDKIANRAKDVSGIVIGRRMEVPSAIAPEFLAFVSRSIDATKQARKSVRELGELFNSGFRGTAVELVSSMIDKLDEIETSADDQEAKLRSQLFSVEKEMSPIDVYFLYQVIGRIGEVADMAERVGRRLEVLFSH